MAMSLDVGLMLVVAAMAVALKLVGHGLLLLVGGRFQPICQQDGRRGRFLPSARTIG
jgi:hypothetical protein